MTPVLEQLLQQLNDLKNAAGISFIFEDVPILIP